MKRSGTWAVVRAEAPKMPWDDDPTSVVFPRLAAQFGTAFARRHWHLMEECVGILEEHPDDESALPLLRAFLDRVRDEHGPGGLQDFMAVYHVSRRVWGGIERTAIARRAKRKG